MTAELNHGGRSRATRRRLIGAALVAASAIGAGSMGGDAAAATRADLDVVDRTAVVRLQLGCEALERDVPSIGCRWSTPDAAAGYRLIRLALGTDQGRETIARFDDRTVSSYVDSPVRRGVRYAYVVLAYDAHGRLIGTSRPAIAGIPNEQDPPTVEPLRLECGATSATTVRCAGSVPAEPARTLTLWRAVDGGAREVVASFQHPFPSSYGDVVPEGTRVVRYAIIATDGDREIVARSRAEVVRMPDVDRTTPDIAEPEVVRPIIDVPVEPPTVVETRPVTRPGDERPTTDRTDGQRPSRDADRADRDDRADRGERGGRGG